MQPSRQFTPAGSVIGTLVRILTYSFNWRDVTINLVTLVLVVSALACATAMGGVSLGAFFWLPLTLLVLALQLIAAALTRQEDFSLVWASLVGLGLYEQLRWDAFRSRGAELEGLAVAAACACGISFTYYFVEEVWLEEPSDLSGLRGARWALVCVWDRLGTTILHICCSAIGAGMGAAADAGPRRDAALWSVLGVACALTVAVPVAIIYSRRLRGSCELSRVQPTADAPPGSSTAYVPSSHDLAVAALQQQLMRTRDEISLKRSSSRGDVGGEAEGGDGEAALRALEAREAELVRRIAEREDGERRRRGERPALKEDQAPDAALYLA